MYKDNLLVFWLSSNSSSSFSSSFAPMSADAWPNFNGEMERLRALVGEAGPAPAPLKMFLNGVAGTFKGDWSTLRFSLGSAEGRGLNT
jgi:hypothetical protein